MNEEMQKQVTRILELMLAGLEKAGDVASSELPGLINDYLSYFMVEAIPVGSFFMMIVFIVLSVFLSKFFKKHIKDIYPESHYNRGRPTDFAAFCSGAYWLIPLFIMLLPFGLASSHFVHGVKDIIKIKVAPKAYIIEKLRK